MTDFLQLYQMKQYCLFFLAVVIMVLNGCTVQKQNFEADIAYQFKATNGNPDYSDLHYWAAHPNKHNPSDSVPKPLMVNYKKDTSVDIFFIHPTSYTDVARSSGWNAQVDDAAINAKTDYSAILFQASIFNEAGNIFAPRYRQAHLSAYYPITKEDSSSAKQAFELAYLDVKTAFEYYLAHNNAGKPIVIASHSQGSTHAKRLLKEFFDNKPLKNKLVAAYIIGMPVETNYFSSIPSCDLPDQTGCVCSWRTYKNDYTPEFIEREKNKAIVTNPLTWNASITHANRSENKGGVLLKFNHPINKVTDATINNNVLWTAKPHFFGNLFYTTKNYHIADFNLFYLNIRENVQNRITAFGKK